MQIIASVILKNGSIKQVGTNHMYISSEIKECKMSPEGSHQLLMRYVPTSEYSRNTRREMFTLIKPSMLIPAKLVLKKNYNLTSERIMCTIS